jgi:hypothetical protein
MMAPINNPAVEIRQVDPPEANVPPVKKPYEKYKAIQICKEKYPAEFQQKKIMTLAIAVAGIAMLIIPALALGLAALGACSFGVGVLIVAPVILVAASILVKRIEKRTDYWSGDLAVKMLEQKAKKAEKLAKAEAARIEEAH